MNIAAIVSLLAAATGFVFGAIWWRISRAPGWNAMRDFAWVAFTAAGYCALDIAPVLHVSDGLVLWATQGALAFGSLHALAWIRWVYASRRRPLDLPARVLIAVAVIVAALAMIPGVMITPVGGTFVVDAIGVNYRTFDPTPIGLVGYIFFLVAMWFLAARAMLWPAVGGRDRLPAFAAFALTVLAVHDTLATARIIHTPFLIDFGFLVVILVFGLDSLGRFLDDANRLDMLKHRLEQIVDERTHALAQAQQELATERTVAAVGRLAGGVSHEINNPATVISVNVGLLRDELAERGALQGLVKDLLDESRGALHRIIDIVTDLRLSAGAIEPTSGTRVESDLRFCVDMALADLGVRGLPVVRTIVDVPEGLRVRGDRTAVARLVEELVANAWAAAHAEDVMHAQVTLRAQQAGDRIELHVEDNGSGVPEAERAVLLQPFAGVVGGGGRGLGLAVVRGLARQLEAVVRLDVSRERGTGFVVGFRSAGDRA